MEAIDALRQLEQLGLLGQLESNASGNPEWPTVGKAISDCRQAIREHDARRSAALAAE